MAGKAYIYSGPVGALELEVPGTQFLGVLGWSVAGAGDIDGDGSADVIIGAPFSGDSGVAYVYSVKTQSLLFQIDGSAIGGLALGMAVAGAGDLDADGTPEVLLGAPWTITNGKVYAYSIAKHTVLFTLTGVSVVEDFGEVVASAGDVDGDGTSDVIVGVPDATPGGKIDAGSVRVYSGKTGAQLFKLDGTKAGDRLGEGVGALGDIDGDGRAEIIVGAPGMDSGVLQDVGTVLVLGL
jgi:hypothetical protein